MIPSNIKEEISRYLGSVPKPYQGPAFDGNRDSLCEYWDLPAQKDADKPIHLRFQEISLRISQLSQDNENDPQIETLVKEANELLSGVPVTKKYGKSFVTINDLLSLDRTKGIRKEWWELNSKFTGEGLCVFLGYNNIEALATRVGDMLIVMPDNDPYQFLHINQTKGNNDPVETNRIIETLKKLDDDYGVTIVCAAWDYVEFILEKPVDAKSRAGIRQRLYRLCPTAEELSAGIRSGRIALWWD